MAIEHKPRQADTRQSIYRALFRLGRFLWHSFLHLACMAGALEGLRAEIYRTKQRLREAQIRAQFLESARCKVGGGEAEAPAAAR